MSFPASFFLISALLTRLALAAPPPNLILINADDLGYADLTCTGALGYHTPNIDRLAHEGVRATDFYVSSPVCSASRAALLTGCYHERLGLRGALPPQAKQGLTRDWPTLAERLKAAGYATGMAGKWHLGAQPQWLPPARGFDSYLGIPYSGDMWPRHPEASTFPPLALIDGITPLIPNVCAEDQKTFTLRYAERATQFIQTHQHVPFFFYFAPNQPHVPLFVSDANAGKTPRGLFGDVLQEIDQAVGSILKALDDVQLTDRTIVIFTSDNGPWLNYGNHAGSASPLREGKGTCYEGGIRVPFLARWPGHFPAGQITHEPLMTTDLTPTILHYAGLPAAKEKLDGVNIADVLEMKPDTPPPHTALFFYYGPGELQAMRSGQWKLLFPHTARTMLGQAPGHDGTPGKYRPLPVGLELYDLHADIGETQNLATAQPATVADLQRQAAVIRQELGDSLTKK